MALRRSARAGTSIVLRARFDDDLEEPAQASGVMTYIFEPDEDCTDLGNAIESGVPTYWDKGIFEYTYTIPGNGPDGIWTDVWRGTLNGQVLEGTFNFEVSASGIISEVPGQLHENNIVEITVHSGILAIDTSSLQEDYIFSFMTEINPAYTNATKVRLEAGAAFPNLEDDVLYLAILEASLEANALTFNTTYQNSNFFYHARREWTTCKAAAILATNARASSGVSRKSLGDFAVQYDLRAVEDLLNRIAACLKRWETQLNAGGYGTMTPVTFIKGELDLDRPQFGRLWRSTENGGTTRRIPAANTREQDSTSSRRWLKGFTGRWK